MTALNHLLAATDLSVPSLYAVDRGFLLAKELGARYTVMHALAIDSPEEFRLLLREEVPEVWRRMEETAVEALTQVINDPSRNAGVSAAIHVEKGLPVSTVPASAQSLRAGLVLLGAHGGGFLQNLLLGSTTSNLLRNSECPVLVVKRPADRAYRRVLIPVDFSPASEIAIRVAQQIAPEAHLVLLHIYDVPFEGKMLYAGVDDQLIERYRKEAREHAYIRLGNLARSVGLSLANYTGIVLHGNPVREILDEETKHGHDLIVMGKHGTHLTEELLLGSLTKRVLAESHCDVLVVLDKRTPDFTMPLPDHAKAEPPP